MENELCNGSSTFLGNSSCHLLAKARKKNKKKKQKDNVSTTLEVLQGFFVTASIPRELNDPRGRDDDPMTRLYFVEGHGMQQWHTYTG